MPSTGIDGQNDLVRQFQGQTRKAALIVDERWNSGGQIPTRFIELLNRPVTNYWARRDGKDWPGRRTRTSGPKCMLINGLSGSGGDAFPFYFRQAGLGKTDRHAHVGRPGRPLRLPGADRRRGRASVPELRLLREDGTWGVEGHGVDPDIEVLDDPSKMVEGPDGELKDPQLDAAIELMLAEIAKNPYTPPKRPAYPDRSGMGLPDADR